MMNLVEREDGAMAVRIDEPAMRAFCEKYDLPVLPPADSIDGISWSRLYDRACTAAADPSPGRLARLGNVFDGHNMVAEATSLYERVVAAQPDDAGTWHLLGRAYRLDGDLPKSVEAYGRALDLAPDSMPTTGRLADVLLELGEVDRAAPYVATYVARRPKDPAGLWLLGRVAVERGQWTAARRSLEASVQADPNHAAVLFLLGRVYRELGEVERAQACIDRASSYTRGQVLQIPDLIETAMYRESDSPAYLESYMNALWKARRYADAIVVARELVRRRPGDQHAHRNLAALAKLTGRLDEAVAHARRAVEIRPSYATGHTVLGELLRDQGHFDEAIAAARRGVELDRRDAENRLALGSVLLSAGRPSEALIEIDAALDELPDHATGHALRARCLLELGEIQAAVEALMRVLELDPNNRWALEQLRQLG
jgi:tetratricopeptide (TPR) repeat protein